MIRCIVNNEVREFDCFDDDDFDQGEFNELLPSTTVYINTDDYGLLPVLSPDDVEWWQDAFDHAYDQNSLAKYIEQVKDGWIGGWSYTLKNLTDQEWDEFCEIWTEKSYFDLDIRIGCDDVWLDKKLLKSFAVDDRGDEVFGASIGELVDRIYAQALPEIVEQFCEWGEADLSVMEDPDDITMYKRAAERLYNDCRRLKVTIDDRTLEELEAIFEE